MAISIDWATKIISVPKADLTATVDPNAFILPTNDFRLALKALEASVAGMPYLDTHRHNTEVTLSGTVYARVIEIINGYTITFENGSYKVLFQDSNNNLLDVVNLNSVSFLASNSAGMVVAGSGISSEDMDNIVTNVWVYTGP